MASIFQYLYSHRSLVIQLVFTILAFVIMFELSYFFMRTTVHDTLMNNADAMLDSGERRITDTLEEFGSTCNGFAEEVRTRILQKDSESELREYIEEATAFTFLDQKKMSGIQDFFGYFESLQGGPVLIHSSHMTLPEDYQPEEQDWYQLAVEADGEIIETTPYIVDSDKTLATYAKCIFDEKGQRLGVVCMNVSIDRLGQHVIETALNQGGYGMLINQEGQILFHISTDFRGLSMRDPKVPLSIYAEDIDSSVAVMEKPMVSYRNENVVLFIRTLSNGWHLGLLSPEEQYYGTMNRLGFIMGILAAVLASILMSILIQLNRARIKADNLSKLKSSFLANMSHEIRTPINAIVGMTAIGRTAGAVDRKDYCFRKIDDASRHLLGVISDILDMSKIEANRIELSPAEFSFEKMLQQVVNVLNFRIDEKNQKLKVYIDKKIPNVLFADDQRLSQVIANLLSNAIKFTPDDGTIELRTLLLSESDEELVIQIEVTDNGIGISPEQQTKLFQSFRQAEAATSRNYGGTGVGLAISKSIVEIMGGEIWVTSKLGEGATFRFTVKVKRGNSTKFDRVYQNINWGNIRILTVDDDRDILQYFHEIVSGFGSDCEVASDAEEALKMIDSGGDYNIYFVDLRMPGVDGIALTKEIRAREKEPGTSIVIMISSADLSFIEAEAKEAGVDRFLLKPIFPSSISDTINECIGIVNDKQNE
ncbi:MAG: response regulator, partial [Lachnoclostridium sp.]|nr:response regulator [Lachnoclostridium sp.]